MYEFAFLSDDSLNICLRRLSEIQRGSILAHNYSVRTFFTTLKSKTPWGCRTSKRITKCFIHSLAFMTRAGRRYYCENIIIMKQAMTPFPKSVSRMKLHAAEPGTKWAQKKENSRLGAVRAGGRQVV